MIPDRSSDTAPTLVIPTASAVATPEQRSRVRDRLSASEDLDLDDLDVAHAEGAWMCETLFSALDELDHLSAEKGKVDAAAATLRDHWNATRATAAQREDARLGELIGTLLEAIGSRS